MTEGEKEPKSGDDFVNVGNTHYAPTHSGSGDQTNVTYVNPGRKAGVWWVLGASSAVVVAVVAVVVLLTQAGTSARQSSAGTASAGAEDLETQANWCCKLITVVTNSGFYWPGSVQGLSAELDSQGPHLDPATLVPGGLGLVEIPVQTSGTAPILIAPPQVIVRSRAQNVKTGMIAVLPRGGQGGGTPGQFTVDVDSAAPVTMAFGATGQSANLQYVSANSPEVLTLFVVDRDYDCVFDVKLTWKELGRSHTTLLTNGGKHFRIVGSTGLPWYGGDPVLGEKLKRLSGGPFSRYAPGSGK